MLAKKMTLDNIRPALRNSRVFMRVDYNVPLKDNIIQDDTRIQGSLSSIKKILAENPKSLVLASHLGRTHGLRQEKYSLKPIQPRLQDLLGTKVTMLPDCVGTHKFINNTGTEIEYRVHSANNGEIFLLENLRWHPEEEGELILPNGEHIQIDRPKIEAFRQKLSILGNVYVNDAFGTAHRSHSSIVGINHSVRAAGDLLSKELKYFSQALINPPNPFLVILGGAKVKSKITLIMSLLDKVNEMIIGGGMAYTFLKKIHGVSIGKSLFDQEGYDTLVDNIWAKAKKNNVKIHLPTDFLCATPENMNDVKTYDLSTGIPDGYEGFDIGPKTLEHYISVVLKAKLVVWNGPQGMFEEEQFSKGSLGLLPALIEKTKQGTISIIGGGDTVSLVKGQKGASEALSHVSTGGGASLELLEGKSLPGVVHLCDTV